MREPRREDPAESFGPYLIYECLGRGGMATVHRAKQTGIEGFERPVALKRMLPWLTSDAEFIKSFVREARLAAQLRHTNIVQTYDLGKVDSVYYIAMELVPGRDLRELLRHAHNVVGPPPAPVTINLLFQVCDALDYAHNFRDEHGRTLGLVHRDISPANVIVADDGTAKIVDFGVAKGSTATLATMSGMLKGKFAYMAPEMLQGQIDGRCDLFAVGVVAWELLTARPLFAGGDDMEILQRVTTWDPPPPSSVNPKIPRELDAWVAMALAKTPQRRFQNAAQMRAGLELVARTPAMRASAADVATWMSWAFAQTAGVRPSPPPQIPAPIAPPMSMATLIPPAPSGTAQSTTAPPIPGAVGAAPPMPGAPGAQIGGADSVSITIDDSTNPRVAPPPTGPRHTPQVIVTGGGGGAQSGARTMMLDESAMIPVQPASTPITTPSAAQAHAHVHGHPPAHGHAPGYGQAPAHGQVGATTLPGTGGQIKPMPPPGAPGYVYPAPQAAAPQAAAPHAAPAHAAPHAAPPRAAAPARAPVNPNQHATMIGTAIPAAVLVASAAQHRASLTAPPPPIAPSTVPPSGGPAQSGARTVMFDGAPPAAAPHRPAAGGALPAMPPGATPDHGAGPAHQQPYGQQQGYPPAGGGYPAQPQGAPMAVPGQHPSWAAGTPGGQAAADPYAGHNPMGQHHGGPIGGFVPGAHLQGPGGPGPMGYGYGPGMGPRGDLPLPRPPRGDGLLIAIVLVLCSGAAVGGYFLIQHFG